MIIRQMRRYFCRILSVFSHKHGRTRSLTCRIWTAVIFTILMCLLYQEVTYFNVSKPAPRILYSGVQKFGERGLKRDHVMRVLYWPTMLHRILANQEKRCLIVQPCDVPCEVTSDLSLLRQSDAVDFSLNEIWLEKDVIGTQSTIEFPKYRRPDQVWIVSNRKPPQYQYGDFSVLNGVFNWTRWYRSDATLLWTSGYFEISSNPEGELGAIETNFQNPWSKKIAAFINNCKDSNRRYKLIYKLKKYLPIHMYGDCYKPCGDREECESVLRQYRFLLILEDNDCTDYVTEMYWKALHWGVIPIVRLHQVDRNLLIPYSYININDFKNYDSLSAFIKRLIADDVLYNSFLKWRRWHRIDTTTCDSCRICRALHTKRHAQVVQDLNGWFKNDVCQKATTWSRWKDIINSNLIRHLGF